MFVIYPLLAVLLIFTLQVAQNVISNQHKLGGLQPNLYKKDDSGAGDCDAAEHCVMGCNHLRSELTDAEDWNALTTSSRGFIRL